jgi:transcriptional regulator with XRE-family HTH domain
MAYIHGMTIDAEVGKNLHLRMWQRGITQERLARRLGVTQATVSRKIKGRAPWTLTELYEAAAALGVEPGDLLPHLDSNQEPFGLRLAALLEGAKAASPQRALAHAS